MAGRGRGKTLPAWMTNGDATLSSSVPAAAITPVAGQFNDARQPYADQFQAPQRDASSTGHFQSSSSNNGREQYAAPSAFGGRDAFQIPSIQRDAAPHHGAGQGGPAPPQGPPPRATPIRYDIMSTNPVMMPPKPVMLIGQDYNPIKSQFNPQMGLAPGVGSGIAPLMGFQQPPNQLQQQLQPPQYLQQPQMYMPTQQQPLQQQLQQPIQLQMPMPMQMQNPSMLGMGAALQQPVASSLGRGIPLQMPGALPLGMGLGMMPGFAQPIGRGMPLALPRGPAPAPAPVAVGDPNNEVSSWSEHEAEDKRKYWYNRVNGTSTYDKPSCLKTPEERSIPPCKWKEYTAADGKKYYSDGKESSWSVPEEYRVWKEKMDAVERKKLMVFAPAGGMNVHTSLTKTLPSAAIPIVAAVTVTTNTIAASNTTSTNGNLSGSNGASNSNGGASTNSGSNNRKKQVEEEEKVVIVYATTEEAVEAFKAMLTERRVLTTMKMKEVIDLCQSDPRFNALKSPGEKKQALAEYQVSGLDIMTVGDRMRM